MKNKQIDQTKAEAFADTMVGILNGGALALMVSIGHRTSLFDVMSKMSPGTSVEIAKACQLNERYVREWLGAMVTGGIVEYDAESETYLLPAEHAAFLTREVAADNMAPFAQYIPMLGAVEEKILDCFKNGGGLSYDDYGRFHEVMAEDSGQTVVPALVDSILPLVPGMTDQMKKGIDVLDIGCGAGRALNKMAAAFPNSHFTGYDLCEDALQAGRTEAKQAGLTNVSFLQKDLTDFKPDKKYDLVTAFDAIHDQAKPDRVLSGVAEALEADGVFLMQDIGASSFVQKNMDHPIGPMLYTISCLHCMSVSLGQGGAGLGAMWGEEKAREMLKEAGFNKTEVKTLPHDIQNYYYINSR